MSVNAGDPEPDRTESKEVVSRGAARVLQWGVLVPIVGLIVGILIVLLTR
jgi:hypothetical protein